MWLFSLGKILLRTGLAKKLLVFFGVYQAVKATMGKEAADTLVSMAAKPTPAPVRRAAANVLNALSGGTPVFNFVTFDKLVTDIERNITRPLKESKTTTWVDVQKELETK